MSKMFNAEQRARERMREQAAKPNGEPKSAEIIQLKTLEDLFDVPNPTWNLDSILQENTLASIWGLPGAGKTTLVASMACHAATALPWCGRDIAPGLTVYLAFEDVSGLRARMAGWIHTHPHARPNIVKRFRWTDQIRDYDQLPALTDLIKQWEDEAQDPLRLLILDPILAAFGAQFSASDEKDFRNRLGKFTQLLEPFPHATGMPITHCGWSGDHELGSIVQRALSATSIRVTNAESAVRVDIVRQKNGKDGWGLDFRLESNNGLPILSHTGEGQTKRTKRHTLADEALNIIGDLCSKRPSGDVLEEDARQVFIDSQPAGQKPETAVRTWRRIAQDLKGKNRIKIHQGRIKVKPWKQ